MEEDKYSAEFLDIVYEDYTNEKITNAEVDFIVSKIKDKSRVLDIGCGTGRHVIPLAKKGFSVVGLDNTEEMLKILKNKIGDEIKIDLICKDVLEAKFNNEFDAIICFWNAFDQIAKDSEKGDIFFRMIYTSLKEDGKLIIEISNPKSLDLSNFEHSSAVEKDGLVYETKFALIEYDKSKKTTLANELVIVKKDDEVIKKISTDLILRWWEKQEIIDLSEKHGFSKIEVYGDDYSEFKDNSEKMIFVVTK